MLAPDLPIQTERLVLRWYRPGDFDALHAIVSRDDVNRFLYTEPVSYTHLTLPTICSV